MSEQTDRGTDSMARRFADALVRSEESGDAANVVSLFAEDAELRSLVHHEPLRGGDGVRKFWQEYLASFRELRSRFERVTDSDGLAVLEWVTEGRLASGEAITYRGVSIVEHDGARVHRFSTYYDTTALAGGHGQRRENADSRGAKENV